MGKGTCTRYNGILTAKFNQQIYIEISEFSIYHYMFQSYTTWYSIEHGVVFDSVYQILPC